MAVHQMITWQRIVLFIISTVVLLSLGWSGTSLKTLSKPFRAGPKGDSESWCQIPERLQEPHDGLKESSTLFTGEQVLKLQVERLSAAVNISTQSFDDNGDVDEDPRWKNFAKLHDKLAEMFPQVHSEMQLDKINKYGLLYSLPGSDKYKKPILFMAHQDVVPAGNPSTWTHPPFEAYFDGQWLWGRGSADCKSNVVGLLSAMEALLEQDFHPERTIIFSFGFDEETGGFRGATSLSQHLESKLGQNSIAMIHDEGGMGVTKVGDVAYALPATAEKGFVDIVLTVHTPGGHSSRPPQHTAIGIMSRLVASLEDHPFQPTLDDTNPVRGVLECETKFSSNDVEPWLKRELSSGHDIGKKIADSRGDKIRWQIQTSQAVNIIHGGDKDNQLPEEVTALVNYRVRPGEDVDELFQGVAKLVAPIAHKQGLAVSGFGFDEERTSQGILTLQAKNVLEPSPVTPASKDSGVWKIFAGTLRQVFEDISTLSKTSTVVPVGSIATGNSDTAHYWNLTRNILRFTPAREGTRLGVHTVDERMEMNAHLEYLRVYYDLLRNFQSYDGDLCEGTCPEL